MPRGKSEAQDVEDNRAFAPAPDKDSVVSGESLAVLLSAVGQPLGLQGHVGL